LGYTTYLLGDRVDVPEENPSTIRLVLDEEDGMLDKLHVVIIHG
jgi:hypothetical protein